MKDKSLLAVTTALIFTALLPQFASAASKSPPISIGTVKMLPDGTLKYHMRPGRIDACEEESDTVKPDDPYYAKIKAEFGDIKPGDTRPVPPEHHELRSASNPRLPGLETSLRTDRQTYRLGDTVNLTILLENVTGDTPLYIFDEVGLDYSNTLSLRTTDMANKTLKEGRLTSDPPPPPPSCRSFMRLIPGHIYGVTHSEKVTNMGISEPGTYRVIAAYSAPFPANSEFSFGLAFWGSEMGDIPSNTVEITVTN